MGKFQDKTVMTYSRFSAGDLQNEIRKLGATSVTDPVFRPNFESGTFWMHV